MMATTATARDESRKDNSVERNGHRHGDHAGTVDQEGLDRPLAGTVAVPGAMKTLEIAAGMLMPPDRLHRDLRRARIDTMEHDAEQSGKMLLRCGHAPLGGSAGSDAGAGFPRAEGGGKRFSRVRRVGRQEARQRHRLAQRLAMRHFLDDVVLLAAQDEHQRKLGGSERRNEEKHETAGEALRPEPDRALFHGAFSTAAAKV
jgi:hypothetical protein